VAEIASLPALERWHERDHSADLARNRALSAALIEGADALGLPLVSPRADAARGGSVMLRVPDGRDAVTRLRAAGVRADARGTVLRLSPGEVTSMAGVEQALAALRD
jgi:kynureninase